MSEEYTPTTYAIGIGIAIAFVLVAIVAFNFGEIWAIIQTEGLISE